MTGLKHAAKELRARLHGGKPAPTAKPATTDPRKSEIYRQSYAYWGRRLKDASTIFHMCLEYGASAQLSYEFAEADTPPEEVRRQLEKMKAERGWSAALNGAQTLH